MGAAAAAAPVVVAVVVVVEPLPFAVAAEEHGALPMRRKLLAASTKEARHRWRGGWQ